MKLIIFSTIAILICLSLSCKKFVDIGPPANSVVGKTQFTDSVGATSAMLGVYTQVMNSASPLFVYGGITIGSGLAADELVPTMNFQDELDVFSNGVKSSNGYYVYNWWASAYLPIYQINAVLEGVTQSNGISERCKNQLTGEAKFMRALHYFYLVNLFGSVPLVTTTDYRVNATMPRTDMTLIYSQIIDDLKEALNLLSENYITSGKVRPNKFAAAAMLARVYLYQKKWKEAEDMATLVIGSNKYTLELDLSRVFLANSQEAILQLIPFNLGGETLEGNIFKPWDDNTVPTYLISNSLQSAFDAEDKRKQQWMGINIIKVNGIDQFYYYPRKYRAVTLGNNISTENYMLLRYAELFLIRAEARAQQGTISGANSSVEDLNVIRRRAGLPDANAVSKENALQFIYNERRKELFLELGHRWFDLIRTNQIDAVMQIEAQAKGSLWVNSASLYPIPFLEIQKNPFLKQNTGY